MRKLLFGRIVEVLRVFLGVEVVEVAEELIEAVIGRQHVVEIAEMVLAELPGGVALLLEQRRDGDDLLVHADRRAGKPDLRQAGAKDALPGDEGRAAGGAGLLAVAVGEQHAFLGDAVDVGRVVAHQPVRVAAQVGLADVVAPDDEDVRCLAVFAVYFLPLVFSFRCAFAIRPRISCSRWPPVQPNGPIWKTMLTIATTPMRQQQEGGDQRQRTAETGFAPWIRPSAVISLRSCRRPIMNWTW